MNNPVASAATSLHREARAATVPEEMEEEQGSFRALRPGSGATSAFGTALLGEESICHES